MLVMTVGDFSIEKRNYLCIVMIPSSTGLYLSFCLYLDMARNYIGSNFLAWLKLKTMLHLHRTLIHFPCDSLAPEQSCKKQKDDCLKFPLFVPILNIFVF
jgi:hypothetical protein